MEDKITLAVVGCGRIGKMHVENILSHFPNVKIKTLVDNKMDLDWFESKNIPNFSIELNAILEDPEIEAVVIAASSASHIELIERIAAAGKHIFCEKPVGFDLKALLELEKMVEQSNIKLQVGFNRRFDESFQKVKQCVASGEIGSPHIIRITNRDPRRPDLNFIPRSGGLFLDFNIHDFDMVRYISGCEVKSVYARGANLIDPKIKELGDIDTAIINLKLDNNALCVIDSSREAVYGYDQRLEVFGSKGSVEADNLYSTALKWANVEQSGSDKPLYDFSKRYKQSYITQLENFFNYIQSEHEASTVDILDTLQAVAIGIAANRSMQENKVVMISDILNEVLGAEAHKKSGTTV